MLPFPRTDDQQLLEALAHYLVEMRAFEREPDPHRLARVDGAFRRVRDSQQDQRPDLRGAVDAAGAAACDLVRAMFEDPASSESRHSMQAHDHALSRIVDALAPAMA